LARRLIDRIHDAEKERQDGYMPQLNDFKLDGKPIDDRLDHRRGLGNHQHAPSVESVGDSAAHGAYQQPRQRVKESDDADGDGRARDVPHQPTLRNVLHEVARARYQRPFQEKTKIAMFEGTEGSKIPEALHVSLYDEARNFYSYASA
jgi:hypothetical protein